MNSTNTYWMNRGQRLAEIARMQEEDGAGPLVRTGADAERHAIETAECTRDAMRAAEQIGELREAEQAYEEQEQEGERTDWPGQHAATGYSEDWVEPVWQHEEVADHVHIARSQPRDPETGAICFDITRTCYGCVWTERVPIMSLMDLEDQTFSHEEVAQSVNDWIEVAKAHPHVRRNCICCSERAVKGKVLCKGCKGSMGPTVYA